VAEQPQADRDQGRDHEYHDERGAFEQRCRGSEKPGDAAPSNVTERPLASACTAHSAASTAIGTSSAHLRSWGRSRSRCGIVSPASLSM